MTPPTKLTAGRWVTQKDGTRTRTLTYGSGAHGYAITGREIRNGKTFGVEIDCEHKGKRVTASSHGFQFSYKAHRWFMECAKSIVEGKR